MQIPKYIEIKVDNKTVAFLSPNDGLKDVFADSRINGESTLEFSLPSNSEKIKELTPECEIYANSKVYNLLKDEAVETVMDDKGRLWTKFMAVERWNLLDKQFPEPYITNDPNIPYPADLAVIIVGGGSDLSNGAYPVGTASHALYAVLQGSDWTMGICDVTGLHDLETEKVSRLTLIKMIQEIWGGILIWDSVNKVVHLRDEDIYQPYHGFQVRYAKNLKHINRTQSNRLVTKLYCFGKDNLDIASINDGKKYLTDFSYTTREYTNVYSNPDIEDIEELMSKGLAELALNSSPRYNYQVKVVDLRTLPEYSHEEFTLGDMVDIINHPALENSSDNMFRIDRRYMVDNMTMTVDELADVTVDEMIPIKKYYSRIRIIRHRYNLFQPWNCEFELGDPLERLIEKLKTSFDNSDLINNTFDSSGHLPGWKLVDGSVINNKIANASIDASKINVGIIFITEDNWNNNSPSNGYVSWNGHKLFWNGSEYAIIGGNTNKKYIYWDSATKDTKYSVADSTDLIPKSAFIIAINNGGIHEIYWNKSWASKMIDSSQLADESVIAEKIAEASITTKAIADFAVNIQKLADLSVTSAKIADGSITTPKLGDASVDTSKLKDAAITTEKLANSAVDVDKLADLAVDASKLADSAVTTTKIANAAVGSAAIAQAAIGTAHIANAAITTALIQDGAIVNAKIQNGSIDTAKIADATITSAKIKDAAIGSAAIAQAAIGTAHIANGTIITAHIQDAQINTAKIANAAITSAKIANLAVGSAAIQDASIGSAAIADLAVKTSHIANSAITSAKIADAAITNAKIGTAAIKSANIEDLAVTTVKIGNFVITEDKIASLAVTGDKIANLAITNAKIANATIQSAKIVSLSADKITAGTISAIISIESPKIYSGTYYGQGSNPASIKLGLGSQGNLGDLGIYRGGGSSPIFQIYDDLSIIDLKALGNRFLGTTGVATYAYGTWNFSTAGTINWGNNAPVAKFA